MDMGFRVQYSDLAMLQWVQLQVLSADQTIVVDKLDNSTRTEWDGKKQKWNLHFFFFLVSPLNLAKRYLTAALMLLTLIYIC